MSEPTKAEQIRQETYGSEFVCARCREKVNGLHHADPKSLHAALAGIGWHPLTDGRWVCSRKCLDWQTLLAKTDPSTPMHVVKEVGDRAYQNRRAALSASPPVAAPVKK